MVQPTENIFHKGKKVRIPHLIVIIIVNIIMIGAVFIAGLWPFNFFPENGCRVDLQSKSLDFSSPGICFLKPFKAPCSTLFSKLPFSINIELKPSWLPRYRAYILDIYDRSNEILSLFQWKSALIVQVGRSELCFSDVMIPDHQVKVTVTVAESVLTVCCEKKQKCLKNVFFNKLNKRSGLFVVGNSPSLRGAWHGEIYSMKISNGSSDGLEILPVENYLNSGAPPSGNTMSERLTDNYNEDLQVDIKKECRLQVPRWMTPLKMAILTPPWKDFKKGRRYELDLLLNTIGFVPLGLSLCMLFHGLLRMKRYWLTVITTCVVLSLFIEVLQVYLITRTSQMSDLILNSWGGVLGVVVYVFLMGLLSERKK